MPQKVAPTISIMLALMLITPAIAINTVYAARNERIRVIVSVDMIRTIVSPLIEGIGEVSSIVSGDVDPHTFTLTLSIIEDSMRSDLIVISGHIEWEEELVMQVAEERGISADVISLNLLKVNGIRMLEVDGEKNLHGFWLLPDNALVIAEALADKLKGLRPELSQKITENYISFREKVLNLKDFLSSISEKYGLLNEKVALGFYAEQYIAEAMSLKVGAILIGEEGMVKPSTLMRVHEGARSGEYSCIVISDVALLMENIKGAIREISKETGCPVAYVITVSAGNLQSYDSVMYYNAGQICNAILSKHMYTSTSSGVNAYYLTIIVFLLIAVIFEALLLVKMRAKI